MPDIPTSDVRAEVAVDPTIEPEPESALEPEPELAAQPVEHLLDGAQLTAAAAGSQPGTGLRAVRAMRILAERLERQQVRRAREQGWSWQDIADQLGVTRQAVHQKHAAGMRDNQQAR